MDNNTVEITWWKRAGWRWGPLVGLVAALASLPAAIGTLPADGPLVSLENLLEQVRSSDDVAYSGVVESSARLGFPDVRRAERLAELLGEKHRMRVWYRAQPSGVSTSSHR